VFYVQCLWVNFSFHVPIWFYLYDWTNLWLAS
jgi:hypothetical protein